MLKLYYVGHSCFSITDDHGVQVVIDPFHAQNMAKPALSIGYREVSGVANYLLVSHEHADHNATELVAGDAVIIKQPGSYSYADFEVCAVEADHDNVGGTEKGHSRIFKFKAGNLCICHLGDFGQDRLRDDQMERLQGIDVLLLPIGGGFTIAPKQAITVMQQINSAIVIPMHYKTQAVPFLPNSVEDFIAVLPENIVIQRLDGAEIELSESDISSLAGCTKVLVLQP